MQQEKKFLNILLSINKNVTEILGLKEWVFACVRTICWCSKIVKINQKSEILIKFIPILLLIVMISFSLNMMGKSSTE